MKHWRLENLRKWVMWKCNNIQRIMEIRKPTTFGSTHMHASSAIKLQLSGGLNSFERARNTCAQWNVNKKKRDSWSIVECLTTPGCCFVRKLLERWFYFFGVKKTKGNEAIERLWQGRPHSVLNGLCYWIGENGTRRKKLEESFLWIRRVIWTCLWFFIVRFFYHYYILEFSIFG